jgi:hypothetical protein
MAICVENTRTPEQDTYGLQLKFGVVNLREVAAQTDHPAT